MMVGVSFLQSREWEEFQRAAGRAVWRRDGVLFIRHDVLLGLNYLYCPRPNAPGSVWSSELWNAVGELARQEKSMFLKIDPAELIAPPGPHFRISRPLQPQKTSVLYLGKSEDDLRSAMHEKMRYNIRLAERKGVEVKISIPGSGARDFESFWRLMQETTHRDRFHTHGKSYYKKLLDVRSGTFSNELFFAEYQGEALAAALVNFHAPSGTATYLHGASGASRREVMAPHLLHWRIIQEAKKRGLGQYDFWGIDEKRWPGVTRFKLGFGGAVVAYPASIEILYRPWQYRAYHMTRWVKSL